MTCVSVNLWYTFNIFKLPNEASIPTHIRSNHNASILLSQGVQLLTISRRLGHSDANITLKTYSHILDEMKVSEAQKIKDILTDGTNAEQNSYKH